MAGAGLPSGGVAWLTEQEFRQHMGSTTQARVIWEPTIMRD